MTININLGMSGAYKAKVLDKEGNIVQETDWFDNLLVDEFFEEWFSTTSLTVSQAVCFVGTGTTPAAVTDTGIEELVATSVSAAVESETNNITTLPYYAGRINSYDFGLGNINTTLTEVAIRNSANPSSGFTTSRALFPTPLEVTDEQQLVILWEFRVYIPDQDIISTVGDYEVTIRPARANNNTYWRPTSSWRSNTSNGNGILFSGPIQDIDSNPSGTSSSRTSFNDETYITGSMSRARTFLWGPNVANQSNMSLLFFAGNNWQAQFSPTIDKTNTERLEITVQITASRV